MGILLLIVLIILLVGELPQTGYHQHGYGPSGLLLGLLLVIVILLILGHIPVAW